MRRLLSLAAVVAGLISAFAAHAGEPLVRVRVLTAAPFAVGQAINIDIQVLAPNYFLSPVEFPTLSIPGAIVAPPADRPLNFTETIGGEIYAGIHQIYSVVPEQPGAFTLPPAKFEFTYAAVPGQTARASLTLPEERIEVAGGAGRVEHAAEPLFALTQSFDRDLAGLKAGDALIRTVTIVGRDMPAMMIPPPSIQPPAGVKLYRHDPELADGGAQPGGRRIERLTYEFPRAGDYVIPSIAEGGAGLAEIRIHIAAAAPAGGAIAPAAPALAARLAEFEWSFWVPRIAAVFAGSVLLVALWRRYAMRGLAAVKASRLRRVDCEDAYFTRLMAACRGADPAAAFRALNAWASRAGLRSLSDWAERFGDPALAKALQGLEGDLFGPNGASGQWDGATLGRELKKARRHWRQSSDGFKAPALPALN
jgi:hypothetical protein